MKNALVIASLSALPLALAGMFLFSGASGDTDYLVKLFASIAMVSSIPFIACLVVLSIRKPNFVSKFGNWIIKRKTVFILFLTTLLIAISYLVVYIRKY